VREPATDAHIPYLWANSGDRREALQIDAGSIRDASPIACWMVYLSFASCCPRASISAPCNAIAANHVHSHAAAVAHRSMVRQQVLRCAGRDRSLTKMSSMGNSQPTSITLQQSRVVVAGGTSGIGFAVAEAAARSGAEVIIASSRPERVAAALEQLPQGTRGESLDFTDEAQVRAFFARVGALDHLVYTAGESLLLQTLAELSIEAAQRAFEVRYWGALKAVKYAAPLIRPGGSITLTSGVASSRPLPAWTIPSSILGAIESLTRTLAVELAPLRVNAVAPGVLRTALWDNMSEGDRESLYDYIAGKMPVRRVGEASDVAQTYLYLMQQGFSTGQVIVVDGGHVLV
jgi:NAD(P)-dependent dehydrogenase (short-subunit alcohol dehydrogenase family)